MPANLESSAGAQDSKWSVFIPIPKKGNAKEYSNYHTIALISHTSKLMLKILQARLQQYVNCEIPDVQAEFRRGRGTRDQIANIFGSSKKQESSRKTSTSALLTIYLLSFIDKCQSLWLCGPQQTLENSERDGIPDHLTCLLRNLYAGQEATVRTGHGTKDWFQIGKGICQGCILSPCLFNLYAGYIMRNAGLDEAQAGIKIAGRNINNLRYADDTTLWQKVKRNSKASWRKWKWRVKKLA